MIFIDGREFLPDGTGGATLEGVAHALGCITRFQGAAPRWTVLHHQMLCGEIMKGYMRFPAFVLAALTHDVHEAVTGDWNGPWKTDAVRAAEQEIQARLMAALGLPDPPPAAERYVHEADARALAAECHEVLAPAAREVLATRFPAIPGDRALLLRVRDWLTGTYVTVPGTYCNVVRAWAERSASPGGGLPAPDTERRTDEGPVSIDPNR